MSASSSDLARLQEVRIIHPMNSHQQVDHLLEGLLRLAVLALHIQDGEGIDARLQGEQSVSQTGLTLGPE